MAIKLSRKRKLHRVSRLTKNQRRLYVNLEKQIRDKAVRSRWSNRKTVSQNLKAIRTSDILGEIPESTFVSTPKKLGEREHAIIQRLYEKYGNDIISMSRDMRKNPYQWNSNQCEKRLKIYKAL
ncbi:hypothetical protein ACR3K2_03130 [Cryptosporidium serpentis]